VISSVTACDRAFAVTEPTPLGAHDLKLITELLMKLGIPFEVILNRYEKRNEAIILDAIKHFRKDIFAKIPYKKDIAEAYSRGVPIRDNNIREIAGRVIA
jgi:MinD superfamily P-loop ATPase